MGGVNILLDVYVWIVVVVLLINFVLNLFIYIFSLMYKKKV